MEIGGDRQYSMKSDSISRLIHPARERERETRFLRYENRANPFLLSPAVKISFRSAKVVEGEALLVVVVEEEEEEKKKIIGKPERLAVIGEEALGMRDEIECWKAKCLFSSDVITDKKSGTR